MIVLCICLGLLLSRCQSVVSTKTPFRLESPLVDSQYPWEALKGHGVSCSELVAEASLIQGRSTAVQFLKHRLNSFTACYGSEKLVKKDRKGQSDAALFAFVTGAIGQRRVSIPGSSVIERPSGWSMTGPFLFGKTEHDGDPLSSHAGGNSSFHEEARLWSVFSYLAPLLSKTQAQRWRQMLFKYPSEVVPRGFIDGWKQVKSTAVASKSKRRITPGDSLAAGGHLQSILNVDHSSQLQGLVQELGGLAVMEFVSFAMNEYILSEGCTINVQSSGLHSLFYSFESTDSPSDSPPFTHAVAADLYQRLGSFSFSLESAGLLRVYVRLRGVGRTKVVISLSALKERADVLSVEKPISIPDIVGGTFFGPMSDKGFHISWIPVPITLHSSSGNDPHVKIALAEAEENQLFCFGLEECGPIRITENSPNSLPNRQLEVANVTDPELDAFLNQAYESSPHFEFGPIEPGAKFIAPILVGLKQSQESCVGSMTIKLELTLTDSKLDVERDSQILAIEFRCRDFDRETFIATSPSFDGSIISLGVRAPISGCGGSCPIVLSLHGTGVSASNQADSFKVGNREGGFSFGVEGAWLVAPDRHGAHNWETVGRQSALASLFQVSIVSGAALWGSWADKNRVIYTGHSMGGHGALHLAVMSPNRALGCIFNAGWLSKEHYGEANKIFNLDRGTSYTDGPLKGILEAAVLDNVPDSMLHHLNHIPILVRVGSNDKTVSPFFSRRLVRLLTEAGNEQVQYDEVAGKEHWWWDTVQSNDGGCMNDETVRKFLKSVLSTQGSTLSRDFVLTALSTTTMSCKGAFCVTEQVRQQASSVLTVRHTFPGEVEPLRHSFVLEPVNIRRLRLILPSSWVTIDRTRSVLDTRTTADFTEIHIPNNRSTTALSSGASIQLDGRLFAFLWNEETAVPDSGLRVFQILRPGDSLCLGDDGWSRCSSISLLHLGSMRSHSEFGPLSVCATHKSLLGSAIYIANLHSIAYDTTIRVGCAIQYGNIGVRLSLGNLSSLQESLGAVYGNISIERVLTTNRVNQENAAGGFLVHSRQEPSTPVLHLWAGSDRAMEHLLYDIGQPTVPPMMRAPFTNLLSGYFLSDASQRHKGTGSIFYAGFPGDPQCFSKSGFCN